MKYPNDLIVRKDALDAVQWWIEEYPEIPKLDRVLDDIDALPSAMRWTPVKEKLPKKSGDYMVTIEYVGWHAEIDYILSSARYTKTKGWHLSSGKVIAWMPLPEVYHA